MMIRGRFALSREAATYTRHRTFQLTFNLVQLVAEMCEHRPPSSTTTFPSTVSVDCRLTVWTWDSMLQGSHTEWEMVSEERCWKIYFNGKSCEAWKKNGCIFSELVEYEKKTAGHTLGTLREKCMFEDGHFLTVFFVFIIFCCVGVTWARIQSFLFKSVVNLLRNGWRSLVLSTHVCLLCVCISNEVS